MPGGNLTSANAQSEFVSRTDDIYISGYPRSGTTWMQMILYQLTSDRTISFEHIFEVIPFLELSLRDGRSLESLPSPRIFKSHLLYRILSRYQGRYIYIMRDGRDVLVSNYYLYKRYYDQTIVFSEYFNKFIKGHVQYGSWFRHVKEWMTYANEPNVFIIRYEDLIVRLDECLKRIIAFCQINPMECTNEIIARGCSFEFMKQYEMKFAPENAPELHSDKMAGPQDPKIPFLRAGKSGSWREMFTKEQELAFCEALDKQGIKEILSAS
jgi:hypothetical protein